MLRLVHPAREGQGIDLPKGRRRAPYLALAPDEARSHRAKCREARKAIVELLAYALPPDGGGEGPADPAGAEGTGPSH